jgi:murein L,D-transpeptidase YcbB/YkuD
MTHPVLRVGATGDDVKTLQTKLQERGNYVGQPVDGKFGPHTLDAVKLYQYHRWCNHPVPPFSHQPVPNPPPPFPPVCQPLALSWPLAVDGVVGFNTWSRLDPLEIKKGAKGPFVVLCQSLLNFWKWPPPPLFPLAVDGDFGDITDKAVRSYQTANGLKVDGIVGPHTWAALHS